MICALEVFIVQLYSTDMFQLVAFVRVELRQGPDDFRDHGFTDRIAALANTNTVYCETQNTMEFDGYSTEILLL